MNPIRLLKLVSLGRKGEAIVKEQAPMKVKVPQLVTLFGSLSVTLGLPEIFAKFVHAHPSLYLVVVGIAIVLHSVLPSVFSAPNQQAVEGTGLSAAAGQVVKALALALVFVLLALATPAHGQNATTAGGPAAEAPKPAATTTTASTSNGFVASSDALAIDYRGSWSVATLVRESYDFIDVGTAKTNHISIIGTELPAPGPGISLYTGGVMVQPDLSKLLSKTNVPAGSLSISADASAGAGIPSTGGSHFGWLVGAELTDTLTTNLSWRSLQFEYGGVGAQRFVGISTGLQFAFGK